LYRFDENSLRLAKESVLLENVKAIDPTLLQKHGKWYLYIMQKDFPSVKLYLYISDSFKGPFEAYYNNPIKIDCGNARPAGALFEHKGLLFRPAQECKREYGTAVCLNAVDVISDKQYVESIGTKVHPVKDSAFDKGLHTINGDKTMVVFDGKKYSFTFSGMLHQIKQKIHR
jgi:hypothetical protein